MAKERPLEENELTLGEKHEGMNYTARTYFFYTTAVRAAAQLPGI